MDEKKILDKLIEFFRKSLEDGWIKDFFSWVFWGIGIATILSINAISNSVSLHIFSAMIFFMWLGTGLALFDKIQEFFIHLIYKENKGKELTTTRYVFILLTFLMMSLFIFFVTFSSMQEVISFLAYSISVKH